MMHSLQYDEFACLRENAREIGLPWDEMPSVQRAAIRLDDGRQVSAILWGNERADIVLLHGGGQNAHTWDNVAMALRLSAVAIDMPGHGRSDASAEGPLNIFRNCHDIADVVRQLARPPVNLVGMSLGGLTALALADAYPELVRTVLLVDVTPDVDKNSPIARFINGPETFATFEDLVKHTAASVSARSETALRRGILHNAVQLEDGSWRWRRERRGADELQRVDFHTLWDAVSSICAPIALAYGELPSSVVTPASLAEFMRRRPTTRIVPFPDAGHSIQGRSPVELARLIADFRLSPEN